MENSLKLPLDKAINKSISLYPGLDEANGLIDFIMERLKVYLKADKIGNDRIDSIFSKRNEDDINRLIGKVKAIDLFVNSDDGANLIIAYRRAANLVSMESKKDGKSYRTDPDEKIFQLEHETYLLEALKNIGIALPSILEDDDFNRAMQVLASLRSPIDSYFENVTVNTDDLTLRDNRLRLLSLVVKTMNAVADFSVIEGS
jgi:glycyl-tRNA synthetase beta chain